MMCTHCDDTGSLSRSLLGYFDCPFCDIAEERTELEAWIRAEGLVCNKVDAWRIYQRGAQRARSVTTA